MFHYLQHLAITRTLLSEVEKFHRPRASPESEDEFRRAAEDRRRGKLTV